jgi:hypothetical protein
VVKYFHGISVHTKIYVIFNSYYVIATTLCNIYVKLIANNSIHKIQITSTNLPLMAIDAALNKQFPFPEDLLATSPLCTGPYCCKN